MPLHRFRPRATLLRFVEQGIQREPVEIRRIRVSSLGLPMLVPGSSEMSRGSVRLFAFLELLLGLFQPAGKVSEESSAFDPGFCRGGDVTLYSREKAMKSAVERS